MLCEKALVSGAVLFQISKFPNAEVESTCSYARAVPPFNPSRRFISVLLPHEMGHERCLTSIGTAKNHQLHAVEAPGTAQLAVEVADAVAAILLQALGWIAEVYETAQVEVGEIGESSHLYWECQNVSIIAEIKRVKCGERANAERHIAEVILGQVEGTDGRSYYVERQVLELIVREVESSEVWRPLGHSWDFCELVA